MLDVPLAICFLRLLQQDEQLRSSEPGKQFWLPANLLIISKIYWLEQSKFAMTSQFPIQKERRVSITLLFIGMIVISKAFQPSSRFCNPITTHRYQRSSNLNSLVETNKKESTAKSLLDEVSDETGVKGNSIDTVRDIPSSPIFERVQRSLARLTEIIPRPVTLAVVAVASSLLLFELSKTLLFLAVPVIAVLGKC